MLGSGVMHDLRSCRHSGPDHVPNGHISILRSLNHIVSRTVFEIIILRFNAKSYLELWMFGSRDFAL